MLDLALCALSSRNLEIYPLMYGDPEDVNLVDVGRGLTVMLSGVRPELRSPLEAVFFFSILKNGVPIAYGPASSFLGAFWFYRKLGFSAVNPAVEALAQSEEAIMAEQPGYRCSLATLRKLSHTSAYLDLSGGRCRPSERAALDSLAPLLCLLPDLPSWSRKDLKALAAIVRAKGGPCEADFARRALAHPRFGDALRAAATSAAALATTS